MNPESIEPAAPELPPLPPLPDTPALLAELAQLAAGMRSIQLVLQERGIDYRTGLPVVAADSHSTPVPTVGGTDSTGD
jgi:hypothetical protein